MTTTDATATATPYPDGPHPLAITTPWLTIGEAAAYARRSAKTIRRWADARIIRTSRVAGGRRLVDRRSLVSLLEGAATGGEAPR